MRFLSLLLNQLLRVARVLVSCLVTAVARLISALPGPSLPASLEHSFYLLARKSG